MKNHKHCYILLIISLYIPALLMCNRAKSPRIKYQISSCFAAQCHGASSLDDYLPGSGKHIEHLEKGLICENCHKNYAEDEHHKNSILNAGIDSTIVFFDKLNPSTIWDNSTGDCSFIACHGGVSTKINWYKNSDSSCAICHVPGSSIDPLIYSGTSVRGKHLSHVSEHGLDCSICHNNYKENPRHINGIFGKIEDSAIISFDKSLSANNVMPEYNDYTGYCENIICHGSADTLNWYSDENECALCHTPGSLIDPLSTGGKNDKGNHISHVTNRGIECVICHKNYEKKATHNNGLYRNSEEDDDIINFGGYYYDKKVMSDFDKTNGICDNISCHGGSISVNWYSTNKLECIVCHETNSDICPMVTNNEGENGKHLSHVQKQKLHCERCHKNYLSKLTHMNGTFGVIEDEILVYFDKINSTAYWNEKEKTCKNMTCHGPSDWYTTEQLECTSCHTYDYISNINPLITGGTGAKKKYDAHYSAKGIVCVTCHSNHPANSTLATHMNGTYGSAEETSIIYFEGAFEGFSISGDFEDNSGGCDNITCHKVTNSAYWYSDTNEECAACHEPGSSIDPRSTNGEGKEGKHIIHVIKRRIDCIACHEDYSEKETHMKPPYGKAKQKSVIAFNQSYKGINSSSIFIDKTGTCYNIICHGSMSKVNWYSNKSLPCASCHEKGSAIDPNLSGSHLKHFKMDYDCLECHATYKNEITHLDGKKNTYRNAKNIISFNPNLNPQGAYDPFSSTCIALQCHGALFDLKNQGNITLPEWDNPTTGECGTCHKTDSSLAGGTHEIHLSPPYSFTCDICHNDSAKTIEHHSISGMHVNGYVNIIFADINPQASYDKNTHSCINLYCHLSPPIKERKKKDNWGMKIYKEM